MDITKSIPRIVAGSAAAGFGLSLGRDIYKGSKPTKDTLILALLMAFVIVPVIGIFYSGLLIFRNQPDASKRAAVIVGGAALGVLSLIVGFLPTSMIFFMIGNYLFPGSEFSFPPPPGGPLYLLEYVVSYPTLYFLGYDPSYGEVIPFGDAAAARWVGSGILFVIGAAVALAQRSRRRKMHEAEIANEAFMSENGLEETSEGHFVDQEGNKYRFEGRTKDRIELFALGRRNRRGFIEMDGDGRFTSWSGLVSIR